MNKSVYKTEKGEKIIEDLYKRILDGYTMYPFKQLYLQTGIAQTHILKFGDTSKPPLIMIHGSVSNSASWLGCISEFINDFCIYCVDIPGEPGLSEPNRCSLNSEEPFEWLDSLLGNLKIEKAYFVTMSLGSWYALNFAIHKPEKIAALSMITTGGLVPAKKSFIIKSIFYMLLGKPGQRILNKAVYHKIVVPESALEFQAITAKHFNPVLETLPIFSDEQLKKITFPVQFFGGECDSLINSIKTAERLKSILPDADIHLLKDTGHAIIDQFVVVKEFLIKFT
jgi:pimeloyl-ACP methyl ester carboxylesterase